MGRLGGGPDGQAVRRGVRGRDHAARFDRDRRLPGKRKGLLDHQVGFCQGAIHIAFAKSAVKENIIRQISVKARRVRCQAGVHI